MIEDDIDSAASALKSELEKLSISKKKILNIVFVGHVDSGKSTISGRILMDLNLIDERLIEKYKIQAQESNRGSWYLSWCLDINPEEREKGITTEVGTASFDLPNTHVNILDAPGHKKFVNEMIEGASRADLGVLIISARSGEFEAGFKGGQTKEHLLLLRAGSVEKLVILVNKMDEINWDEARYEEIKEKIVKYINGIFSEVTVIPVSGYHGDNILKRKILSFYDGMSFLEYLDTVEISPPKNSSLLILEKIKTSGNIYFYAKVEGGEFTTKKEYKILPLNKEDRIISIQNEDDVEVGITQINESYKFKFKDCSEEIRVGNRIVSTDNTEFVITKEFYAQLGIYEVKTALTVGYSCIMHINVSAVACKIVDMFSLDKKRIKIARRGDKVVALIRLEEPVVCNNEMKDRFSLRDESLTIAAGVIKKIKF